MPRQEGTNSGPFKQLDRTVGEFCLTWHVQYIRASSMAASHPPWAGDGRARRSAGAVGGKSPNPVEAGGIEAATYYLCAEALTNATKHAGALRSSIEVRT